MATSMPVELSGISKRTSSSRGDLEGIDFIRIHAGNAYQWMHFLRGVFGFTPVTHSGLKTGARHQVSYVLAQEKICLVVTSPLEKSDPIVDEIRLRGDAVKDVAFTVKDAADTYHLTLLRGASPVMPPALQENSFGKAVVASIRAIGSLIPAGTLRCCVISACS